MPLFQLVPTIFILIPHHLRSIKNVIRYGGYIEKVGTGWNVGTDCK
jgi:hypothetical protein